MPVSFCRRTILAAFAAVPFTSGARAAVHDGSALPPPRELGQPGAKLVVQEWFSLTCSHCADFAIQTFPQVKAKLIDTGRIRCVFRDIPSDRAGMMAAIVARALPPVRYQPFVAALFASQAHWAFDPNVDPREALAKMAMLAGMSREAFDHAVGDPEHAKQILAEARYGEDTYHIEGTPTFVFGSQVDGRGAISYADFEQHVESNGG